MHVVWSQTALDQLEAIADHVARHSPTAAYDLADTVTERTSRLADNPLIGRGGRVAGTRELVLAGTAYIVVYEVGERVDVLAVMHGAREWPEDFRRP